MPVRIGEEASRSLEGVAYEAMRYRRAPAVYGPDLQRERQKRRNATEKGKAQDENRCFFQGRS